MNEAVQRRAALDHATHFELACRAAGIGVWELHVAEQRLVYSDLARAIFGLPPDGELTRDMVHSLIHPDDLPVVLDAARRAMDPAIRGEEHYVYRIRRFDTGALRWVRGHGIAHFDGNGAMAKPTLYAGSVLDITERELTRQALAASEERLRLAIDAAEMAVWDLDLESGTVAQSADLNRMLGFPADATPSVDELRSRYAPGERERLEAEGAAAQARGETSMQTRVRYIVPGKGEVTYVLRAALAFAHTSEPARPRVIGVLFDATEQARAENRLLTINEELRHRLKNMANLAAIFAGQTWPGDRGLETFMGRIRALTMSADLMFGSRTQDLRLHDLVQRSLDPFRPTGADPFTVAGPDVDLDDMLFGGLALLLHELATNAVKHGALSRPEGRVALTWQRAGTELRFLWQESGGPRVSMPSRQGFGMRLISRGALPPPHQVECDFRPDGLAVSIVAQMEK